MKTTEWTIQSILDWTVQYFSQHQIQTPRLDAELLLGSVLNYERIQLYLQYDQPLIDSEKTAFRQLIKQRVAGVPVAYLLNKKAFWTLDLFVKEGVLIPRPDTEILVERCLFRIHQWQQDHPDSPCRILELGTGSGAIPLALCSELKQLEIVTVDRSSIALEVAQENLNRYSQLLSDRSNHITLICSNGFEKLNSIKENPILKFDFLVSNPPYIPSDQIQTLQKEVNLYEPHDALDGGTDGLDFYRYLLEEGRPFLKSNGWLLLEIGFDQKKALNHLVNEIKSLQQTAFFQDLQGNTRVLECCYT